MNVDGVRDLNAASCCSNVVTVDDAVLYMAEVDRDSEDGED